MYVARKKPIADKDEFVGKIKILNNLTLYLPKHIKKCIYLHR
jgi:hypothetical protein